MDRSFWLNSVKVLLTFRSYSCVQNTNVTVKQGEGESIGHGYWQVQAQHLELCVRSAAEITRFCVKSEIELKVHEPRLFTAHFSLPANEEMRHCNQKSPKRHQYASECYDLGSVQSGAKVAHKCNHQQIPYRDVRKREGTDKIGDWKGIRHVTSCWETSN